MPTSLTTDQVLALAPDPASAKAGKSLSAARAWVSLGQNEQAVWGECQGSGKEPYRTQIDLSEPAFRCSCPSRKFPCKHGLGLLLLLAAQPAAVPTAAPPAWVEEWLASRAKSAQRRSEKQQQDAQEQDDPAARQRRAAAQAKTVAAREAKVAAGMQELGRWLRDQVRQGLAGAQQQAPAAFDTFAARMVDAQAPGVARLIRDMGGIPASGPGWQARLLEQLAGLHLLVEGYQRLEQQPPARQADIRATIGFTQNQDELLAAPGLPDQWLVLGQRIVDEERLRVQRTWLWGLGNNCPALILDFAVGNQPLDCSLVPGSMIVAELVFFPGAVPLRALLKPDRSPPGPIGGLPQGDISAATEAFADALAANPWLERFPFCLGPVTLEPAGDHWLVCDQAGRQLALQRSFRQGWELLALSGGRPFALCGEWDGAGLAPLSAWAERFILLEAL